jgi:hypothetical protein
VGSILSAARLFPINGRARAQDTVFAKRLHALLNALALCVMRLSQGALQWKKQSVAPCRATITSIAISAGSDAQRTSATAQVIVVGSRLDVLDEFKIETGVGQFEGTLVQRNARLVILNFLADILVEEGMELTASADGVVVRYHIRLQ